MCYKLLVMKTLFIFAGILAIFSPFTTAIITAKVKEYLGCYNGEQKDINNCEYIINLYVTASVAICIIYQLINLCVVPIIYMENAKTNFQIQKKYILYVVIYFVSYIARIFTIPIWYSTILSYTEKDDIPEGNIVFVKYIFMDIGLMPHSLVIIYGCLYLSCVTIYYCVDHCIKNINKPKKQKKTIVQTTDDFFDNFDWAGHMKAEKEQERIKKQQSEQEQSENQSNDLTNDDVTDDYVIHTEKKQDDNNSNINLFTMPEDTHQIKANIYPVIEMEELGQEYV